MDADKVSRLVEQRNKAILAARTHLRDLIEARKEIARLKARIRKLEDTA